MFVINAPPNTVIPSTEPTQLRGPGWEHISKKKNSRAAEDPSPTWAPVALPTPFSELFLKHRSLGVLTSIFVCGMT